VDTADEAGGGELTLVLPPSRGSTLMNTFNPTPPSGGTAGQILSATAVDLPAIVHTCNPVRASLRYRLRPDWAATLGYTYEKYDDVDWRSDALKPATVADIWLGNDLRGYQTGFFTFTISYRPSSLPVRRPML
jgi:hypothetical protein